MRLYQAKHVIALLIVLSLFVSIYYLSVGRDQSDQEREGSHLGEGTKLSYQDRIDSPGNHDLNHHGEFGRTPEKLSREIIITPSEVRRAKNKQHLNDVLAFPSRLAEFNFDACDMSTCFDLTLCNSSDTLRIHIVASTRKGDESPLNISGESNIIHERILNLLRSSKYYEPDPKKACLFVPEDDTIDRDPLSTSFRQSSIDIFRPEHRFGMNHLLFNLYSGTWPDYKENDFAGLKIGAAILAKASNSLTYHRDRFDISIPLFSFLHPITDRLIVNKTNRRYTIKQDDNANHVGSKNKTFFLTFKGKRYVIGTGSETRNSLYHLNNQRDVIMLTTCRHGKKWREINDARCLEEDSSYEQYDFVELMKESIFCLTPRGRRLGSFRFLEALNHTCIPVVLGDGWVWPFDELIDWTTAAIQFPESEILLVPDTLRDFDSQKIKAMQLKCQDLYQRYFASINKIVMTTIEIIEMRIKKALGKG
uniref:Exostosin-1 n=1 Tax=Aceria tosichella TaxID=561515 RepID=A0A6G1SMJ7_9ACAR